MTEHFRTLYQQDFAPPDNRCDFVLYGNRCVIEGGFVLITDAGEVRRFSCDAHLGLLTMELRARYGSPVMVDLYD